VAAIDDKLETNEEARKYMTNGDWPPRKATSTRKKSLTYLWSRADGGSLRVYWI